MDTVKLEIQAFVSGHNANLTSPRYRTKARLRFTGLNERPTAR